MKVRESAWPLIFLVLGSAACADRPANDPPPDLLDRRIADCEALCSLQVSDCGPLPNEHVPTHDDCVRECATLEGLLSSGWGYQYSTDEDACASEWRARVDCLVGLSCEAQQLYWQPTEQDPPRSERACYDETEAMHTCVHAHPCCEDSDGHTSD